MTAVLKLVLVDEVDDEVQALAAAIGYAPDADNRGATHQWTWTNPSPFWQQVGLDYSYRLEGQLPDPDADNNYWMNSGTGPAWTVASARQEYQHQLITAAAPGIGQR